MSGESTTEGTAAHFPDRTVDLRPGEIVHLTPRLRHRVRALEPTTLTVTMLLPRD